MKILVADDDAVSRSMMRRMLMQSGYEVATATNGAEAIEALLGEDAPRLVLLDWMMPEADGPEVCQAVRTAPERAYTYITLLTSKEAKEDLVAGLGAGADDYLTKPCNLEELRARLRTGERILELEDTLVRAREEMRYKATHDALTGLLNRGAVLAQMGRQMAALRDREMAVVLCDIDHFKRINDTMGHPVGDEVLREIARRLRGGVRSTDTVGRYGGEEFLLLLEGCSARTLAGRAEEICEAVRSAPVETSAGPVPVTISLGALVLEVEATMGAERVLHVADEALYAAKRGGRDRAVLTRMDEETGAAGAAPRLQIVAAQSRAETVRERPADGTREGEPQTSSIAV